MVLILPETDERGAFEMSEGLRLAVRALGIPHDGSEKGVVTISVGVATSVIDSETSPSVLLDRADEAVYIAKEAGRDRVMGWSPRHERRAAT